MQQRRLLLISAAFCISFMAAGCVKSNILAIDSDKQTEFIEVYPGQKKNDLYTGLIKSLGIVYKKSSAIIKVQNMETGDVILDGYAQIPTSCYAGIISNAPASVSYKLSITVRDEKIRFRFDPALEKAGLIPSTDAADDNAVGEAYRNYVNAKCYWTALSGYLRSVTDALSTEIARKDNF